MSNLTGLATGSTYYVRAYATNSVGTAYGNQQSFTTINVGGPCKVSIMEGTAISICAGPSTQLTALPSGFPVGSTVTYSWSPETGLSDAKIANPLANPVITTTYKVTATDGTCTPVPTAQVKITVNPLPLANVGINDKVCAGSPVTLGAASVAGSTYSWTAVPLDNTLDANKTKSNPTVSPTQTTTYTLRETNVTTGCFKENSISIYVNTLPVIDFTFPSGNQSASTPVQFTSTLTGSGSFTYSWNFGDGTSSSIIANPSHVFATNAGNGTQPFNVTLTVTNTTTNCVSSKIKSITINQSPELTVTDIDGNVYHTVTIGTQVWMVENLKTTKYRNGDPIANITVDATWAALGTGAYCWYNNAVSNKVIYGALYNWFVVEDNRNIAPPGWHVPTDEELTTLTIFLGGEGIAGGKLKEKGYLHWSSPNLGATNEFGFTALPGGVRQINNGMFVEISNSGYIWSSSMDTFSNYGLARSLQYNNSNFDRTYADKKWGFYIRCIKD